MKIGFRIGAKQDGEQSRGQDCPVDPTPTWPLQWPVPTGTPPAKNHAEVFLRRGAACCARLSTADQRRSLATKKPREITQLSGISTRFWSKSRSYRKQKTKPCLPGSRIAQCDALFLSAFCACQPLNGSLPVSRSVAQL